MEYTARTGEIGFPECIATLQNQLLTERRLAEDAGNDPTEDIVSLDMRGVDTQLLGFLPYLIGCNH